MENTPEREPEETGAAESSRTEVLLEEVRSNFRAFDEGLSDVRRRLERMEPKLDNLESEINFLNPAMRTLVRDMKELKGEMKGLKGNVEKRLTTVESKVGL